MSKIDTGGATAIKGFNYQKASMILVMIKNHRKEAFMVIPEAEDDFEIRYENKCFFIQVKGTKNLSLSNLTRRSKGKKAKEKPSILEKNISPGENTDIRKLFLWSLIDSTKKELEEVYNHQIISPIYKLSNKQKNQAITKLNLNKEQICRLNNQYIYITPFINDNNNAITFLNGVMVNEGLITDKKRARLILGELCLQIDQKSEIAIINQEDYDKKIISGDYLGRIFTTSEQMYNFDQILNTLEISSMKKMKIRKEKVKIPFLYQSTKAKIKSRITADSLLDIPDREALEILIDLAKEIRDNINDELLWALAIECYCELGEELYDN